jgi:hypothetical protein
MNGDIDYSELYEEAKLALKMKFTDSLKKGLQAGALIAVICTLISSGMIALGTFTNDTFIVMVIIPLSSLSLVLLISEYGRYKERSDLLRRIFDIRMYYNARMHEFREQIEEERRKRINAETAILAIQNIRIAMREHDGRE